SVLASRKVDRFVVFTFPKVTHREPLRTWTRTSRFGCRGPIFPRKNALPPFLTTESVTRCLTKTGTSASGAPAKLALYVVRIVGFTARLNDPVAPVVAGTSALNVVVPVGSAGSRTVWAEWGALPCVRRPLSVRLFPKTIVFGAAESVRVGAGGGGGAGAGALS